MWALYYFCFFIMSYALGAEFTLPGECPNVKIQEKLDYTKFSGSWYNVASYASDGRNIYDCASLEFQEDNLGYTLRETYIDIDLGNRTQKSYFARVDPTFDAGSKAQFIVSHEDGDKVLQFPFFILSTDYSGYAIAYTCKTLKKKQRTHYVFTWVLSRNKEKLQGETLKNVEDVLSKYTELAEHRQSFVLKDFSDISCGNNKPNHSESQHILAKGQTRKRCVICYAKLRLTLGAMQAAKKVKKIMTNCSQCKKAMCLHCFNEQHAK